MIAWFGLFALRQNLVMFRMFWTGRFTYKSFISKEMVFFGYIVPLKMCKIIAQIMLR